MVPINSKLHASFSIYSMRVKRAGFRHDPAGIRGKSVDIGAFFR